MTGESWMRWTVRITVLFYCAAVCLRVRFRAQDDTKTKFELWLWTAAWTSYLAHVVLAFEFVHNWSHQQAWLHTAVETQRVTGILRGDGLWVNYVFTILWGLDIAHHWFRRPSRVTRLYSKYFAWLAAFIVLNATVVFGPRFYVYLSLPYAFLLIYLFRRARRDREFVTEQSLAPATQSSPKVPS